MTFKELPNNQAFTVDGNAEIFYKKDFGDYAGNCLDLRTGKIFFFPPDICVTKIQLTSKNENTFFTLDYGRYFTFDSNPSVICQKISMNGRPGYVVGTRYFDHDDDSPVTLTY